MGLIGNRKPRRFGRLAAAAYFKKFAVQMAPNLFPQLPI